MTTQVQFRRGTTAEHASFTGAEGEITVDTDKKVAVVHDGSTAGGFPMRTEDNPLTTDGDLWTRVSGADARVALGGDQEALHSNGTTMVWAEARGWRPWIADTAISGSQTEIEIAVADGYDYLLIAQDLIPLSAPGNSANLRWRVDEGSGDEAGASAYAWGRVTGVSLGADGDGAGSYGEMVSGIGDDSVTDSPHMVMAEVLKPGSADWYTYVIAHCLRDSSAGSVRMDVSIGARRAKAAADTISIFWDGGEEFSTDGVYRVLRRPTALVT